MFEDTIELAENKLLVLYTLKELKIPISKKIFNEIMLETSNINYFSLQQYLTELEDAKFLSVIEQENVTKIQLTEKGDAVLILFENRISEEVKKQISSYLTKNLLTIKNKISTTADYTIGNADDYIVKFKAIEGQIVLLDLKFSVPTKEQAKNLCNYFKENSSNIYGDIISILMKY